ncbi:Uncharacterized protein GBIM_00791 [Gryllus bimaculatus]|nr:Uncharacterized protein GBIM_00791 [Gryllus bimaculatus]
MSLELFNPETDDMDSDSSGVSSPDSVSSVISVLTEEQGAGERQAAAAAAATCAADGARSEEAVSEDAGHPPAEAWPSPPPPPAPRAPEIVRTSSEDLVLDLCAAEEEAAPLAEAAATGAAAGAASTSAGAITSAPAEPRVSPSSHSLLEAAADVASSLEDAVDAVIQSSPRARRRKLQLMEAADPMSLIQGAYGGSLLRSESFGKFSPGEPTPASKYLLSGSGNSASPVVERRGSRGWAGSVDSSRRASPRRAATASLTAVASTTATTITTSTATATLAVDPLQDETGGHESWDESCRQHLADFAEKLSEKLLEEIDQYRRQTCQPLPSRPSPRNKTYAGLPEDYEHIDDPYLSRLSEELEDLTKLSEELQRRNSYIATFNETSSMAASKGLELSLQDISAWRPKRDAATDSVSPKTPSLGAPDFLDHELLKDINVTVPDRIEDHPEFDVNISVSSEQFLSDRLSSSALESSDVNQQMDLAYTESYSRQTSADITEDLETCLEEAEEPEVAAQNPEVEEQPVPASDKAEAVGAPEEESACAPPEATTSTAAAPEGDADKPKGSFSLRPGYSIESSDAGDTASGSGKTASTASLGPESSDAGSSDCSRDVRYADRRTARCDGRSSSEEAPLPPPRAMLVRQEPPETLTKTESCASSLSGSTSQESLPSDNGGGAITFHRYYHVFREGELDQLIERYVENLHIISSYYDHANWCVVAEKVQIVANPRYSLQRDLEGSGKVSSSSPADPDAENDLDMPQSVYVSVLKDTDPGSYPANPEEATDPQSRFSSVPEQNLSNFASLLE